MRGIASDLMSGLSCDLLHEMFIADDNGFFIRKASSGNVKAGDVAGTIMINGYRSINIGKRRYLAHRLMWLYFYSEWPVGDIDHINGDRDDNRIKNLRSSHRSQNNINSGIPAHNTSGFKGARFDKRRDHWVAEILFFKKKIYLGSFSTAEEAGQAYQAAARKYYGEFAREQ